MKTMFLIAAMLWVSATNKIFANDVNVTPAVLQTFKTEFFNASNVEWSRVDHLYKAVFKEDGDEITAFFNLDGSLVATCRYLTVSELPRTMQHSLKTDAATYAITEIFAVQDDNGIDYYATVQKDGETKILKADATKWMVYKK